MIHQRRINEIIEHSCRWIIPDCTRGNSFSKDRSSIPRVTLIFVVSIGINQNPFSNRRCNNDDAIELYAHVDSESSILMRHLLSTSLNEDPAILKKFSVKCSPFNSWAKDASCCEGLTVTAYLSTIHDAVHSTRVSRNDLTVANPCKLRPH